MANKWNVWALTWAWATANLTWANAPIFNNSWVFSNPITQTNQNSWIWFTYKSTNNSYQGNYTTYNKNYPWFDKNDYEILERMAAKSGKTGQAKKDLMDELYMQYYEQVVNKHQLDDRSQVIKEQAFSTKDYQWNDKKVQKTKVKLADLSQKAKKKFWIDATVSDEDIINSMTNSIPNWWELLENYINNWDKEYLYAVWLEDDTILNRAWDVATDIVWWAYDSVTSLPRMAGKWIANAIWWTAKQLWADENKVDRLVQSYKDYLDNEMSWKAIGANTDSFAYQATKTVWDLTQVAAWEWLLKWAIQGTAKWGQLLNYLKNAPTWQKMVAWWVEWAWDMALYSIVAENKLPTMEEEWVWATIGSIIPWAWALYKAGKPFVKKALNKTASQLQLSWLLNPAKLNTIKNNLISEWTDLATAWLKGWTAEDVWTWMIERWFNWDKEKIITDLWEYAKKSHKLKREVLWASESLHDVESAKKSLQIIRDTIEDVPWLENRLKRVDELLSKEQHTLAELDEIKSILDDTKNLYTTVWNPKAWAVNEWLIKVRQDLRKYIEDAAEKEWLGNIKMLNNETQIAKWLQDWISRKDSADAAREMLSVFSKSAIGWAAWYNVWPFDSDTIEWKIWNVILWALAWKYLFSTASKTKLASLINKMSWWSKKELSRLVAWDLEAIKLTNKTKKELENLFKEVEASQNVPTEMTPEEWEALYKKYSYSDLPALEFKEWIVDDAGKTILAWDSEKIISTPSWTNLREWKIWELPTKNVNYVDNVVESNVDDLAWFTQQEKNALGAKMQDWVTTVKDNLDKRINNPDKYELFSYKEYNGNSKEVTKRSFLNKETWKELELWPIEEKYVLSKTWKKSINENFVDNAAGQTKWINENISKTTISEDASDLLPLNERVWGDDLLNAEDLIDEIKSVWAKVDENWYVTVYHQTTPKAAEQIRKTGKMSWKENWIFFSTSKDATQAEWRWTVKLEFKIPAEKLQLDDIFTNNADVKISSKVWEQVDISKYLVKNIWRK